jgi:hypothetical protein
MNNDKPAPSALLQGMMADVGLEVAVPPPATVKMTFDKIIFDMTLEGALKTTIVCRGVHSDGTTMVEARSCTVEKKYSPMDVMDAIAHGDIPPPWAWPNIEEGFV